MARWRGLWTGVLVATVLACATPAWADRLEVAPAAPLWIHLGAGALLWLHIGGGTVGLVSGAVAVLAKKGGPLHRAAGAVFVVSMLAMAGIGGVVAPFLHDRISTLAGFMTCYFIVTGWCAARRRSGVGVVEKAGLVVACAGLVVTLALSWMAASTPEGTLDGSPPQAFWIFSTVSLIAAATDAKVVLRRGIDGAQRIARHVWRMCFAFFVASGSLFLGQMQLFPAWLQATPVLYILALAPLPFLVFWMLCVRLAPRWRAKGARTAVGATS